MDKLGDRMKLYESAETSRVLMRKLPTLARIDGRCFSSFTRGLRRPFDETFNQMMVDTTKFLCEETNATLGYTQSDEITLCWIPTEKSEFYFAGKVIKMVTALAAQASVYFYKLCLERLPQKADKLPTFDARVWQVPNLDEVFNCFLWREWDATKNSISMAAREFYSDKECYGKTGNQKQEMLFQKGVNWNNYPSFFKCGTYVKKAKEMSKFSSEELEKLPARHAARTNPDFTFSRSVWKTLDLPPISQLEDKFSILKL